MGIKFKKFIKLLREVIMIKVTQYSAWIVARDTNTKIQTSKDFWEKRIIGVTNINISDLSHFQLVLRKRILWKVIKLNKGKCPVDSNGCSRRREKSTIFVSQKTRSSVETDEIKKLKTFWEIFCRTQLCKTSHSIIQRNEEV